MGKLIVEGNSVYEERTPGKRPAGCAGNTGAGAAPKEEMERGNVRELPRPLSWKAERKYLAGLKS